MKTTIAMACMVVLGVTAPKAWAQALEDEEIEGVFDEDGVDPGALEGLDGLLADDGDRAGDRVDRGDSANPRPAAERERPCRPGQTPAKADRVVVNCREFEVRGLNVRNWKQKRWPAGKRQRGNLWVTRFGEPTYHKPGDKRRLSLHETASTTHQSTYWTFWRGPNKRVINATHFIIARDGRVTQHEDLTARLFHDGTKGVPVDSRAVGIEVVGAFTSPKSRTFKIGHRHVPTLAQLRSLEILVNWLVDPSAGHGLNIQNRFAGRRGWTFDLGQLSAKPRVGIWAHHQVAARDWDGILPAVYLLLRRLCDQPQLTPKAAHRLAVELLGKAVRKRKLALQCPATAHKSCVEGLEWDSGAGRCVPRGSSCAADSRWSEQRNECVARCAAGQTWSEHHDRCLDPCGPGEQRDPQTGWCEPPDIDSVPTCDAVDPDCHDS